MTLKKDVEHGTSTMYRRGCRCSLCQKAQAEHAKYLRSRKRDGLLPLRTGKIRHGTITEYTYYRCRCKKCREFAHEYFKRYYKPRKPKRHEHGLAGYKKRGCRCDICVAARQKEIDYRKKYYFAHKDANSERVKKYRVKNRKRIIRYLRKYYWDNRDKLLQEKRQYQIDNKDAISKQRKQKYIDNKKEVSEKGKRYYREHRASVLKTVAKYREANRELIRIRDKKMRKTRIRPLHERVGVALRSRLRSAIKNKQKRGSAVRDLGCTVDEVIKYLESQFLEGMTWGNWGNKEGQWSIDHIRPLKTFNLEVRKQFLEACHYTNLRPLWHRDNIRRPRDGSDIPDLVRPKKKKSK